MKAEAVYFPVWHFTVIVQCHWHGEYAERRTITRHREVTKQSAGGRTYTVKEPYDEIQTVWHPHSGGHSFSQTIQLAATNGLSAAQLAVGLRGINSQSAVTGHPILEAGIAVSYPQKSQRTAWDDESCGDKVQTIAQNECKQLTERLKSCSAVPSITSAVLFYVPVALVNYNVNESEFRHCINLRTGDYSGDVPLDNSSVYKECEIAGLAQRNLDHLRWAAFVLALPLVLFLLQSSRKDWVGWSLVLALALICQHWKTPWKTFLWQRKSYFLRLLASPPESLRQQICSNMDAAALAVQPHLHVWLEDNMLQELAYKDVAPALNHPGKTLLKTLSPKAARRIPLAIRILTPLVLSTLMVLWNAKEVIQLSQTLAAREPSINSEKDDLKPLFPPQSSIDSVANTDRKDLAEAVEQEVNIEQTEISHSEPYQAKPAQAESAISRMLFQAETARLPPAVSQPDMAPLPKSVEPHLQEQPAQARFRKWLEEDRRKKKQLETQSMLKSS